jgi:hypothetical protein
MTANHKTIFPDTNYFLHYPSIDQTDWNKIADAASVVICVCMQVIHELDDKKNDPRLKERAKRAIKELRTIRQLGGHVRPNVRLEMPPEDIRTEGFRPGLNPANADDRILQCVLSHKGSFPHEEVHVLSEDLGMEIKCGNLNISLLRPDEQTRLPDLEDFQSRKLRQTQQELDKHKNALPDLTLSFKAEGNDSSSHFNISFPSTPVINVEEEMNALRGKYPSKGFKQETSPASLLGSNFLGTIGKGENERYNHELEEFFNGYEGYLKVSELLRQANERSFSASFTLENNGHSPAHQIDIHIHFPDGMNIFDASNLPPGFKERNPPMPPREPRRGIENLLTIGQLSSPAIESLLKPFPNFRREELNVSPPRIVKSSSYDIRYEVKKLKHGYILDLGELLVQFSSKSETRSFSVDFAITADNLPGSQSGTLHFIVPSQESR